MAKRKEFEDTIEATEFMYKLDRKLHSKKLMDWAETTDANMGTTTVPVLMETIKAYGKFVKEMENYGHEHTEKPLSSCPCCGGVLEKLYSGKRCFDTERCGYHTHETVGL